MHSTTFRRGLASALAAGLCLAAAAPAGAVGLEEIPVRPAKAPNWEAVLEEPPIRPAQAPDWDVPATPPLAPAEEIPPTEEELTQTAELRRISGLLADFGLTQEQTDALCVRLAADSALLALLEGGELTGPDLAYLALPNGWASRLDRYSAWAAKYPDRAVETVALQVNLDQDHAFYTSTQTVTSPESLTVLVNKHYLLSAGYVPKLEALGSHYGSGSLRPEAAAAFRSMADAARAEGVALRSVSAYRSYQQQKNIYNSYLRQDRQASVDTYSARPGASEHQTGLALDINVASSSAHFENTAAFAWLKANCAKYGFILRYDQGKESITGYRFEPWHYRYVGTEIAQVCMEQGLCYEEYLALRPET